MPYSSSRRTLTGTSAFSVSVVDVLAALLQELAQRAGHDRQHDVVDGAAEPVLDLLDLARGRSAPSRSAGAARSRRSAGMGERRGPCARARRLRVARLDAAARRRCAARGPPSARSARSRRAGSRARSARRRAAARTSAPGSGCHCGPVSGRRRRLGGGVEQHRGDVDAGDAVDEAVVRLREQREARRASPGELSPRSSPCTSQISHSGLVRSSCCANTRLARFFSCSSLPGGGSAVARTWYSRLKCGSSTHTGPALAERHEAQLLAEARHQREPALDVLEQLVVASAAVPRRSSPRRRACATTRPRGAGRTRRGLSGDRGHPSAQSCRIRGRKASHPAVECGGGPAKRVPERCVGARLRPAACAGGCACGWSALVAQVALLEVDRRPPSAAPPRVWPWCGYSAQPSRRSRSCRCRSRASPAACAPRRRPSRRRSRRRSRWSRGRRSRSAGRRAARRSPRPGSGPGASARPASGCARRARARSRSNIGPDTSIITTDSGRAWRCARDSSAVEHPVRARCASAGRSGSRRRPGS